MSVALSKFGDAQSRGTGSVKLPSKNSMKQEFTKILFKDQNNWATQSVWMHRSKAETDHGGPVAGKAAIDAAVAAGLYEERVIFGGKDKGGKPVRISQIRVKEQ